MLDYISGFSNAAIAFSGGVDSSFLLYSAKVALDDRIIALSVKTPYIPAWEIEEAMQFTAKYNIRHKVIEMPIVDSIHHNPENRCYLCKKELFGRLLQEAKALAFSCLLEGTNNDDTKDYRPGIKALQELSIHSPLLEKGITKQDIRELSKQLGLQTWNKPAYACLLTRIPYNTGITTDELNKIEKAEQSIRQSGFPAVRVRSHGNLARIEIPARQIAVFVKDEIRNEIVNELKNIGYRFVSLDLQGYSTGSFNKTITAG